MTLAHAVRGRSSKSAMENKEPQPKSTEDIVLDALVLELHKMEKRKPNRSEGVGDIKYEVLYDFTENLNKTSSFDKAYAQLNDVQKHIIITRLENSALNQAVSYDFVENLRQDLYGTVIDDDGGVGINYARQHQLEAQAQGQDIYKPE